MIGKGEREVALRLVGCSSMVDGDGTVFVQGVDGFSCSGI